MENGTQVLRQVLMLCFNYFNFHLSVSFSAFFSNRFLQWLIGNYCKIHFFCQYCGNHKVHGHTSSSEIKLLPAPFPVFQVFSFFLAFSFFVPLGIDLWIVCFNLWGMLFFNFYLLLLLNRLHYYPQTQTPKESPKENETS